MDALLTHRKNKIKKRKNDGSSFQRTIFKTSIYKAQQDIIKEKKAKTEEEKEDIVITNEMHMAAGLYIYEISENTVFISD